MKAAIVCVMALFLLGCSSSEGKQTFAGCLTGKGAKMYGAYWCPHCQNQKAMFGDDWKNINYIECSLPNRQGQTEECREAAIMGYPTWEFADGSRIEGEATFQQLGEKTGCVWGG
jgi:hypothetical protein